jgi:acetyl-CoA C-acetyltransferase
MTIFVWEGRTMLSGIRDKVAIIGMGCTKFGELWDKSGEDLLVEAFVEALEDSGVDPKDLQAAWIGTQYPQIHVGESAVPTSVALKLPFIPVTRVENFCVTGTDSFRGACYGVASGAYDFALAIGMEKLKDVGYGGLPDFTLSGLYGSRGRITEANTTAPGMFAMLANRYFNRFGIEPEKGKEFLAKISVKSHDNGYLNPRAHLRRKVSVQQVLAAPIVAWPLGLFDCCGVSDGAAAAIVVRADIAKDFRRDPIYVKALQVVADSGESMRYKDFDLTHIETTSRAALQAYSEAGIRNPREEIGVMEVHDCFSITELVTYEDLQISSRGRACEDLEIGFFELNGKIPCQPSGGLKCFGHPIGASGIRMIYEIYKQLQGKSGSRQVRNPKLGLTHNLGGVPTQSVAGICILGA